MTIRRSLAALVISAALLLGAHTTVEAASYVGLAYDAPSGRMVSVYCTHAPTVIAHPVGTLRSYCLNVAYAFIRYNVGSTGGCNVYVLYGEAWKYTTGIQWTRYSQTFMNYDPVC